MKSELEFSSFGVDREQVSSSLFELIEKTAAVIGVMGLGYVGQPLAIAFAENGYKTIGFDVDIDRVCQLRGRASLTTNCKSNLQYSNDPTVLGKCDVVLICVPTPVCDAGEPDMRFVRSAADLLRAHSSGATLVILKSTVYPGATRKHLVRRLCTFSPDDDRVFFFAFSPEREDPGNREFSLSNTPKVVAGLEEVDTRLAEAVFRKIVCSTVEVPSIETAELVKLLENTFRAVNISLVNDLKIVCSAFGADIWKVVEAASTKPFGFMSFYPGPGIGGHCIAVDPLLLAWSSKNIGAYSELFDVGERSNRRICDHIIRRISIALESLDRRLENAKVLVVGISYKENVADLRNSPSLRIITSLQESGATVAVYDPLFTETSNLLLEDVRNVQSLSCEKDAFDLALICAGHDLIDYDALVNSSACIVDTRRALPKRLREIAVYFQA